LIHRDYSFETLCRARSIAPMGGRMESRVIRLAFVTKKTGNRYY
jgi:hypothetical protein